MSDRKNGLDTEKVEMLLLLNKNPHTSYYCIFVFFVELTHPMDLQYRYRYWYRPVLRDYVLVSVVSVENGNGVTLSNMSLFNSGSLNPMWLSLTPLWNC